MDCSYLEATRPPPRCSRTLRAPCQLYLKAVNLNGAVPACGHCPWPCALLADGPGSWHRAE